jgi:hypothetical protein
MNGDRLTCRRFLQLYLPYLLPAVLLVYMVLESYQMDFRPYYVAGRQLLLGRNFYLNPVGAIPELFVAVNAAGFPYSGFIYPPFAALLFAPLALLPYATAKLVYSGLTLACLWGLLFCVVQVIHGPDRATGEARQPRLQGEAPELVSGGAIALVMCSFPVLAHFERGQFDLVVCYLTMLSFVGVIRSSRQQSGHSTIPALLLAIACGTKVFPIAVLIFWAVKRQYQLVLKTTMALIVLMVAPIAYFGTAIYQSYLQIMLPGLFGALTADGPIDVHGQGVINRVVLAIEGNKLRLSHDFVNGYMNPFLRTPTLSLSVGLIGLAVLIYYSRSRPIVQQFFTIVNAIHLINPQTWIMGLVWYIPLFLYSFDRASNLGKIILVLPLFCPPSSNANGMLAYGIALSLTFTHSSLYKLPPPMATLD